MARVGGSPRLQNLSWVIWVALLTLVGAEQDHRAVGYRTSTLDVVLSHFREPTAQVKPWLLALRRLAVVQARDVRIFVYTHGIEAPQQLQQLRRDLQATRVTALPNAGHEDHIYLYHITREYATLADHTIFSQAVPTNASTTLLRLRHQFHQDTGMLALSYVLPCGCDGKCYFANRFVSPELYESVWNKVRGAVPGQTCDKEFSAFMKGEFLVSAPRIYQHSLGFWQSMWQYYLNPIQGRLEYERTGLICHSVSLWCGHLMERGWSLVFNCSSPQIARDCCNGPGLEIPGGTAKMKAYDYRGDTCGPHTCQCRDSPGRVGAELQRTLLMSP